LEQARQKLKEELEKQQEEFKKRRLVQKEEMMKFVVQQN
jgi:hypothetical protein